jgi:dTDP-4-dehydrorhamnose reductase
MNGKKILVTGLGGMLGSSLMNHLKGDVTGFGSEINISDSIKIRDQLREVRPDIIIHTAAYTNVDGCEMNQDKAYLVNAIGTQNLVNYCIDKDILFVYISSTGVYGEHKDGVYTEFDRVNPVTIHHKSKYEGEMIVKRHLSKYLILRTGWLYGGSKNHKKNFIYKIYLEASKNKIIYSDNSQIGNPTYVVELVKQIKVLINNKHYGVFNCVNTANGISRYDYVKSIVRLFGLECNVEVAGDGLFKRVAPVSRNESAVNYKLNLCKINKMRGWDVALKDYTATLKIK